MGFRVQGLGLRIEGLGKEWMIDTMKSYPALSPKSFASGSVTEEIGGRDECEGLDSFIQPRVTGGAFQGIRCGV